MKASDSLPTILCALSLFLGACEERENLPSGSADEMLADACKYLWEAQGSDGGWHSSTHGILKGGQAWTPFVLYALLNVPDSIYRKSPDDVERALDFLRDHVNEAGALGLHDPLVIEYPNYATSYALRVFSRFGEESDSGLVDGMIAYLLDQQFTEERGFTEDSLAFGSWGFGETGLIAGTVGHVDLSHTRRVLQALREAGLSREKPFLNARAFLRLLQKDSVEMRAQPRLNATSAPCRNYDGGFYSSPVVLIANKGGETDSCASFRSYATATCDGLLALLASGYSLDDEPVRAARRWLERNASLEAPEGIPEENPNQWHRVMFFYHLAVRSEVYSHIGWPAEARDRTRELLAERRRPDGSFVNPLGALNKEDDPLLATSLTVIALTCAL